jgi:hypothetical protein
VSVESSTGGGGSDHEARPRDLHDRIDGPGGDRRHQPAPPDRWAALATHSAAGDRRQRALDLLDGRGCPVCRYVVEHERRWLFWFYQEHAADPVTLAMLRRSGGFCPAHTRAVLARAAADVVLPPVYATVVAAARERLAEPVVSPWATCPACSQRDTGGENVIASILAGISDREVVASLVDAGGFCGPHLADAVAYAPENDLRPLSSAAARSPSRPAELVAAVTGVDLDAARRSCLTRRLAPTDDRRPSVIDRLACDVSEGACVACCRAAQVEHRYLDWLVNDLVSDSDSLRELCPRHLHDLAEKDLASACAVASVQHLLARRRLDALARAVAATPPAGRGKRWAWVRDRRRQQRQRVHYDEQVRMTPWRALLGSYRRDRLAAARQRFLLARPCPVCEVSAVTERRTVELLAAAVGHPRVLAALEANAGLCARHVLTLEPVTAIARIVRPLVDARLAVLGWELEEARSKRAWDWRFAAAGDETTAWQRAAAALDGQVYLGGHPAPIP